MKIAWCKLSGKTGHEAGRELLANLYFAQTGTPLPPIVIEDWGKPRFQEDALHFSISHTSCHAFCVLSEHNVGIDAEEMDRQVNLRLADKILSPGEKARYDTAPDKRLALLKFWVLKEAAAKLSSKGLQGYPNHTDFSPEDPRITIIDGCFVAVLEQKE